MQHEPKFIPFIRDRSRRRLVALATLRHGLGRRLLPRVDVAQLGSKVVSEVVVRVVVEAPLRPRARRAQG